MEHLPRREGGGPESPGSREAIPAVRLPEGELAEPLDLCLKELVRWYRHSAVGRRCLGILHNLNSPLQAVSFQLDLLLYRLREEEGTEEVRRQEGGKAGEWRRLLEQMARDLDRLRQHLQRLAFQGAHEGEENRVYLDLNRLYAEELELYQDDLFFKHRVAKEIHLAGTLPPVLGHYIDFSQSFRNLVDNALEAMADSPKRVLTVITESSRGVARLRVGDTGPGIPPELLPRVGTPFFTTKGGPGRTHAGLGLFLARRLLAPYGARLELLSRPDGTWAVVEIPVTPFQKLVLSEEPQRPEQNT